MRLAPVALLAAAALSIWGCHTVKQPASSSLAGRVIVLDPGHGGTAETDQYRVGPSGEREEWVNLRVALMLRDMLQARGATVLMTRTEDAQVGLRERAMLAVDNDADLFLSLHHNATADPAVNFPIVYYHANASENRASVALGRAVAEELRGALFDGEGPVSVVSDHVIFPNSGTAVLRHSQGIPGVIGEASFFTNAPEEERLKTEEHNRREAEAYAAALERFFAQPIPPIEPKGSLVTVEPFEVFQEAERMDPEARRWRENHEEGRALMESQPEEALERLTLSARAFPDSPVAGECHQMRAELLDRLGRPEESEQARLKAREHFVAVP